jgi:hypothetical protein
MERLFYNTLRISGEEKDIVDFIENMKDKKDDDYGVRDILNLEGDHSDPVFIDGELICCFLVNNHSPISWVVKTAKEFPKLTFDFKYEDLEYEIYGHLKLQDTIVAILDNCDGCNKRKECRKKVLDALFTLVKVHPVKWPKKNCSIVDSPCSYEPMCVLIGDGCFELSCIRNLIYPFEEFLKTKGANLESLQNVGKDFKRYRRIEVKGKTR